MGLEEETENTESAYMLRDEKAAVRGVTRVGEALFDVSTDHYLLIVETDLAERTNAIARFRLAELRETEAAGNAQEITSETSLLTNAIKLWDADSFVQAFRLFSKAADEGNANAYYWLGIALRSGKGCEQDATKSFKWFQKAADAGVTQSYYWLGYAYRYGEGCEKDAGKSFMWFHKAAEAGATYGYFALGIAYRSGDGCKKDTSESFSWFLKAAEAGATEAYTLLGNAYRSGDGCKKDANESFRWFLRAAEAGRAEAYYSLGHAYQAGEGCERDANKSFHWFTKAAEAGNVEAYYRLGMAFKSGVGCTQDANESYRWIAKAAEAGVTEAYLALGIAYKNGDGCAQDPSMSYDWFKRAAEAGNADACFRMGLVHKYGEGCDQDLGRAFEWFLKAANAGNTNAYYRLGQAYESGLGCSKDVRKAREWYIKSAGSGELTSVKLVIKKFAFGEGAQGDYSNGIAWVKDYFETSIGWKAYKDSLRGRGESGLNAVKALDDGDYTDDTELVLFRLLNEHPRDSATLACMLYVQMCRGLEAMRELSAVLGNYSDKNIWQNGIESKGRRGDGCEQVDDYIVKMNDSFSRAKNTLDRLRSLYVDPEVDISALPDKIGDFENLQRNISEISMGLTSDWCRMHNNVARALGGESAGTISFFTDRQGIEDALKCLKPALRFAALGWCREEDRIELVKTYGMLRRAVKEKEWSDLISRSGIDPTTQGVIKQ